MKLTRDLFWNLAAVSAIAAFLVINALVVLSDHRPNELAVACKLRGGTLIRASPSSLICLRKEAVINLEKADGQGH